ncbi:MAG: pta, partial [Oscillospiraceae bacterium]|nr:pta [Oscillospiraceae bacterium]
MAMFENFIATLKANPRKIVYTEGADPRILEAAARLKKEGFLTPVLVGNADAVYAAAKAGGFDIEGLTVLDPATYEGMDQMVETMVELRKGKMTPEACREALSKGNYFGTMLVKLGVADALLGGATYSTADTVRPALQLVKTKPGNKIVSSCFILVRKDQNGNDEKLAMGDCAINIEPSEDELVEIAIESAKTAQAFGIE